jgi:hypothetical protein
MRGEGWGEGLAAVSVDGTGARIDFCAQRLPRAIGPVLSPGADQRSARSSE